MSDEDDPAEEANLADEDFVGLRKKSMGELTTPIELANSKQGRRHLVIMNDYIYTHKEECKSMRTWRCQIPGCTGQAMTYLDYQKSMVGALRREHSHLPDPIQVEKCRTIDKIHAKFYELECSNLEEDLIKGVMVKFLSDLTSSLSPEVQAALPKQQGTINRLFCRAKEDTKYFKRRMEPKPK
jgi:hypothetical protein